jgi:hypothetical protein
MERIYTLPSGRRLFPFALGVGVGVTLCLGLMNFHVVRARDGFHLVQKQHAMLGQVYVDATQFSEKDWNDHCELAAAMKADNKEYLMKGLPADQVKNGLNRIAGRAVQTSR